MADQNKVQFVVEAIDKASGPMNQIEKSSSKMSEGVKANLKSLVGPSAAFGAAMGAAAIGLGALGKRALDEAANLEQTNIAFTTMIGSAEEANKFVKDMISFAAKTPFEIKGLETASKQLLAYGFNQADVLPNLKNLGDIASGVGMDKLPNLIMAFGQVKAATKLTGMELRQFTEAGVPLLDELAKVMNKPVKEIGKMVSEGQVGFPLVQQALANLSGEGGKFNNLMEKQSETFSGMMSNLSDSWTNFLRTAGAPLLEVGKKILQWLLDLVNNGLPKAMEFMKNFGQILRDNKPLVLGLGAAIMTALVPALVAAAVAAAPFILAAIELIAIAAVVGGAVYLLAQAFESNFLGIQTAVMAVRNFFATLPETRNNIVNGINSGLSALSSFFIAVRQGMKDAFSAIWDGIVAVVQGSFDLLIGILGGFIGIFVGIFAAFIQLIQGNREEARLLFSQTFINVRNGIVEYITPVLEFFAGILIAARNGITLAFVTAWTGIKNFFVGIWEGMKKIVKDGIAWIADFFVSGGKALINLSFASMFDGLVGIAKGIINGIIGGFEGMINAIIAGINRLIRAANEVSPISIGYVAPIAIPRFAHGGIVGEGLPGAQNFANGGVVSGPAGIDTVPAMLSAGEVVLNAAQQQNLARRLGGSDQPAINITISGNSFFGSDEGFVQQIGDKIIENLKYHVAFQSF